MVDRLEKIRKEVKEIKSEFIAENIEIAETPLYKLKLNVFLAVLDGLKMLINFSK